MKKNAWFASRRLCPLPVWQYNLSRCPHPAGWLLPLLPCPERYKPTTWLLNSPPSPIRTQPRNWLSYSSLHGCHLYFDMMAGRSQFSSAPLAPLTADLALRSTASPRCTVTICGVWSPSTQAATRSPAPLTLSREVSISHLRSLFFKGWIFGAGVPWGWLIYVFILMSSCSCKWRFTHDFLRILN